MLSENGACQVAQWLKNLPGNAGDMDPIPGLGRSYMLWGN